MGLTGASRSLAFGMVWFLGVLFQWFSESIRESEGGQYGHKVDLSFRWSMSWFIFSEVMFFGAFFTALVVGPRPFDPGPGQSGKCLALAGFQGGLAQPGGWRDRVTCRHRGALHDHDAVLAAHHQYRACC